MTRCLLSLAGAVLCASASAGCFVGTSGDLHQGVFAYVCSNNADDACDGVLGRTTEVPDEIAVGASFALEYGSLEGFGGDVVIDGSVSIIPAAPSILAAEGDGFRFVAPGTSAVLAGDGGAVADFLHVRGVPPDHLVFETGLHEPIGKIDLDVGGSKDIHARLADATNQPLAGLMTHTWSSSDESVVTVEPADDLLGSPADNYVTLTAQGAGTATVTVSVDGASAQIPVTVGGTP